jgi:hypothetical protein
MSNSPLVDYTKISPNSSARTASISKITIHHMAGNLSVESCANVFQNTSRQASSNYGVGTDGRVGLYVDESRRAWTSSNRDNDNVAVTIEVANDGGSPDWHISDKALAKTIDLCEDICRRNGIKKLNFTGDRAGNLTMHKYFANTQCPGPYLESKFQYIADEVNDRLGENPASVPSSEKAPVTSISGLPMLRKGSKGASVKALQILLIGNNCSCGKYGADGDFGGGTDFAVKKYQAERGLDADGVVGPQTWAKLLGLGG